MTKRSYPGFSDNFFFKIAAVKTLFNPAFFIDKNDIRIMANDCMFTAIYAKYNDYIVDHHHSAF